MGSSDFTITCVADVTQDNVGSFNVTIQDHDSSTNVILTSRVFNVPMVGQYPVNYTFSQLNPSDTATYSCVLELMFPAMIELNVTSEYTYIYTCIYYSGILLQSPSAVSQ